MSAASDGGAASVAGRQSDGSAAETGEADESGGEGEESLLRACIRKCANRHESAPYLTAYLLLVGLLVGAIVLIAVAKSVVADVVVAVLFTVLVAAMFVRAMVSAHRRRAANQRYAAVSQEEEVRPRISAAALMYANPTHLRLAMMDRDFDANDYDTLMQLDAEDDAAFQGLRPDEIEMLPTSIAVERTPSCSVCLEKAAPGEVMRTLPCLHMFHANCISKWLGSKATCPVCMYAVNVR